MSHCLDIQNFSCEREGRLLISGLNVSVESGQLCQIAGANGSGKTRLIRSLVGLATEWQGQLTWDGISIRRRPYEMLSQLLYLGHQPAVKIALTPMENLTHWQSLQSTSRIHLLDALDAVGLADFHDFPCHSLSAGQQRRVAIARLYLSNHSLWVLDEPFTALDKVGVQRLEELIDQHLHRGGMVVLTTHHQLSIQHSYKLVTLQQGQSIVAEVSAA